VAIGDLMPLHGEDLLFQLLILAGLGAVTLAMTALALYRLIRKRHASRGPK